MYNVSSLPAPAFARISLTMDGSGFGGMPSRWPNTLMKAIAGKKIDFVGTKTSVDLIDDNTTELITKNEGSFYQETITKCCGIGMITKENFCPNCGRKIVR